MAVSKANLAHNLIVNLGCKWSLGNRCAPLLTEAGTMSSQSVPYRTTNGCRLATNA
jgi:hypothetical protein